MTRFKQQHREYQLWLGELDDKAPSLGSRKCIRTIQSTRVRSTLIVLLTLFASGAILALVTRILTVARETSITTTKPTLPTKTLTTCPPSDSLTIESQISASKHLRKSKSPACIDHQGIARDWFLVYKLPKLHDEKRDQRKSTTGYEYDIITSDYDSEIMDELLCVKRRQLCATVREVVSYYDPYNRDKEEPDEFWDNKEDRGVSYDGLLYVYKEKLWTMDEYFNGDYAKLLHRRKLKYLKKKNKTLIRHLITDGHWIKPDHMINDPQSAIVQTLDLAYKNINMGATGPINSLFYNDELPEAIRSEHRQAPSDFAVGALAHAKGAVIMDESSDDAIWLSHSLPKFPSFIEEGFYFHNNSHSFGQTFMCLSFKLDQSGKQIIDHLVEMRPQIYEHVVSQKMLARFPNLNKLIKSEYDSEKNQSNANHKLSQEIETTNGLQMKLFSKDYRYGDDLYTEFIVHELDASLLVQTWRRGPGDPLPSSCPPNDYHTNNINMLKLMDNGDLLNWPFLNDHSKWAINENFNDKPWFCISDINRMHSQFKRGGGAICFECIKCRFLFHKMIEEVEACPKNLTVQYN